MKLCAWAFLAAAIISLSDELGLLYAIFSSMDDEVETCLE